MLRCIVLYLGLLLETNANPSTKNDSQYRRRYNNKLSFKSPLLNNNSTSNFNLYEDAKSTDNFVRLSSSHLKSQGSIWSKNPNKYKEWEIEYSFLITGRGYHPKSGFSFWYTKEKTESGPVFGNRDSWNGLALFHNVYNATAEVFSPYIMGVLNDEDKNITNVKNILTQGFEKCYKNVQNTVSPVHIKISYVDNVLKVAVDNDQQGQHYLPCFEYDDIYLPTGYYIGFSASSEYPTNNYDVYKVSFYEVNYVIPDRLDEAHKGNYIVDGKSVSAEEYKNIRIVRSLFKEWLGETDVETPLDIENDSSQQNDQTGNVDNNEQSKVSTNKGSVNQPATPHTSNSVTEYLSNLKKTYKGEYLDKALNNIKIKISQIKASIQKGYQKENFISQITLNQLNSLANEIEELIDQYWLYSIISQFENILSMWNLIILVSILSTLIILTIRSRVKNNSTPKYHNKISC